MKKINLSKGKFAIVDDEDYDRINKFNWFFQNNGYAVRNCLLNKDNCKGMILMHREINNTPDGCLTDHINRNKLDNRKANLRTVKNSINVFNTGLRTTNKSGHKGVHFDKWAGKWKAFISFNSKHKHLGRFNNIEDAIKARVKAEMELFA